MSQAESTKLTSYALVGSRDDEASVHKLVMYAFAVPGISDDSPPPGQGHVHTQIVPRRKR